MIKTGLLFGTGLIVLMSASFAAAAFEDNENHWPYDPSLMSPFGAPNPERSDKEAAVFDRLIGAHDCVSTRNNYATGESTQAPGTWVWYHDMNGFGVRDVFRVGQSAPASQRVYNPQTKKWHVWYMIGQKFFFSGEWVGGGVSDKIILEKENEKLGDRTITSRLEFYDITDDGYEWHSGNIDPETGEQLFIDWQISCKRRH